MSSTETEHDRPRRRQRHRGHPRRSRTPTSTRSRTPSRTTPTPSSPGTTRWPGPALRKLYEKAKTGQWNATTDLPWETEVDQEAVVIANADQAAQRRRRHEPRPLHRLAGREVGRQGVARVRHREPELDAQPVHARRAGRAALHGEDRRDGAVVRRQALRVDAGDGRGPPRRGVRPLPRREARRATTRSTPTCGCCSTTSSTTAAGT